MELGERIKAARLEAGLSQRQLCGEVITRNMLSLIESGRARPSMDTLRHFSKALGKPMSFFLEEDAVTSPNQEIMQQCEEAYAAGELGAILPLLDTYRAPDPVFDNTRYLLEVLTCQGLAQQAVTDGKPAYALRLLDRADRAAEHTLYAPDSRSRTLLRWQADRTTAVAAQLSVTGELMLLADSALQAGNAARAAEILDAAGEKPPRWHLLRGTAALQLQTAQAAITHLKAAETAYPEETIPLLEQAYLLAEDYKHAYEYAKRATR